MHIATPPQIIGAWLETAYSARAATPATQGRGARLGEAAGVRRGSAKAARTSAATTTAVPMSWPGAARKPLGRVS